MAKKTKKQKQLIELAILIAVSVFSLLVWDSFLIFPVKLFVVLIHEISHGFAAIFSGGTVVSLDFGFDLGGKCITSGGSSILIASAGYLGSLIFGILLFYSAYDKKNGIWITSITAILIILFSINFINDTALVFIALIYPVMLLISPRFFHPRLNSYLLKIFGLLSCIYVLFDLRSDIFSSSIYQSDAQILSDLTAVPAIAWGIFWLALSVSSTILLYRFGFKKGMN